MLVAGNVPYVCPRCREPVEQTATDYCCAACSRRYPVVAGIPDFRVAPDPWIGLEEDRSKARRLDQETAGLSFAASVRAYWEMTPETPRELVAHYVEHVLAAHDRSQEWLEMIAPGAEGSADGGVWLEVGCGTGDFLSAAVDRDIPVIGADIALRWLVVARRRTGVADVPLVCACAEALPFPDAAFDRVSSLGLIEHCMDPLDVSREARRVLIPGGRIDLRTVNRYSVLREPHVHVWGVGFLPRRYADRYVRWRAGVGYRHHRPVSPRELRAALQRGGFDGVRVFPARTLAAERTRLGGTAARLTPVYSAARRTPGARRLLTWIAPLLEATGGRA